MNNSIAPGSSANVNVKVTALTTNPNVPVTYKTIILKKNLVNGVNTLTQEMLTQSNAKYVVKYDFILDPDAIGGTITIPQDCILEFDGGSLANTQGSSISITGQNTCIQADLVKIFNTNVTLIGTWKLKEFYAVWFGLYPDDNSIDFGSVMNIILQNVVRIFPRYIWSMEESMSGINIILSPGIYHASTSIDLNTFDGDNIGIIGASYGSVFIRNASGGQLTLFVRNENKTNIHSPINLFKNLTFKGDLDFDAIHILDAHKITIEDCRFFGCRYSILLSLTTGVYIKHCYFGSCTYGLSISTSAGVGSSTTVYVDHCWMQHCGTGILLSTTNTSNGVNGMHELIVTETIIEYSNTHSLNIWGGTNPINITAKFTRCWFEGNNGGSITGGTYVFDSCYITGQENSTIDGADVMTIGNSQFPQCRTLVSFINTIDLNKTWVILDLKCASIIDANKTEDYRKGLCVYKKANLSNLIWKRCLIKYGGPDGYYIGIINDSGSGRYYTEEQKIAGNLTLHFNLPQLVKVGETYPDDDSIVEGVSAEIRQLGPTWDYET